MPDAQYFDKMVVIIISFILQGHVVRWGLFIPFYRYPEMCPSVLLWVQKSQRTKDLFSESNVNFDIVCSAT